MAKKEPVKPTLGELMGNFRRLRELATAKNKEATTIAAERDAAELALMDAMEEQGVTRINDGEVTFTRVDRPLPTAVDWDDIYHFMEEEKAFYLLERRISSSAFNDLLAALTTAAPLAPRNLISTKEIQSSDSPAEGRE